MGTPGVKLKREAVERAIRECHGVLSRAAEALGCNRFTLYRWIEREPHLKQVREEAGEILLDIAERNVVRGLEEGSASYTKWFLDRKGRSRGYGPRSEIRDDGPERGGATFEALHAALTEALAAGLSQSSGVHGPLGIPAELAPPVPEGSMILNTIAAKLQRRSKHDFKGRHFEAALILQAVSWYLRYPLSYRDIEELFRERGLEVDHSTLNRWVLAYAPLIERRLWAFRKPHCGSVRVDETYIKIRGEWRYLEAAKRFFRKMLEDQPLLAPDRIGTDAAGPYPPAIAATRKAGLLARTPVHYVTKHLQQGIESDHFRVKRAMPRIGGFQSFHTARRTIQGFEAILWLRKGFGFAGAWTVREQNRLLGVCFGLPQVNKA